jgi:acyl-CoA thioester hydrolase
MQLTRFVLLSGMQGEVNGNGAGAQPVGHGISGVNGAEFVHTERARFRDVDAMGHVNNAVFLTYIEQARFAFLAEIGAAAGIEDTNRIVVRVEIDFKAPVRLSQEVEIAVRPGRVGTKSFDFDYVLRVDREIVAEAKSVQVAYDYELGQAIAIPDDLRDKLERSRATLEQNQSFSSSLAGGAGR